MKALSVGLLLGSIIVGHAGVVNARVALQDDAMIEDGLQIVATGRMLVKGCEAISPRRLRAFSFVRSLQKRARDLGYSDAEIDQYLDSDRDKDRVKAKARKYLEARGVNFNEPETLCSVGLAEIQAETTVGRFLWSK